MSTWYEAVDTATLAVFTALSTFTCWDSEPATIPAANLPALYPIFARADWLPDEALSTAAYQTVYRVIVSAGDKAAAQSVVRPYINALHDAVSRHRDLGGLGVARVTTITHNLVTVGGKRYAALDTLVLVEQYAAIGSGI